MSEDRTNLLQIRLTEAEKRHIKTLAASQRLTLRQAALQAFRTWELLLQSRALAADPERGEPASADLQKPVQPKPAVTPRQNQRPSGEAPPLAIDDRAAPGLSASSRAWLRRAAQLDWAKCSAAQRVPGKTGNVWVLRGTEVPLADVLQSVADGQPFLEIAEVFEITVQQLLAGGAVRGGSSPRLASKEGREPGYRAELALVGGWPGSGGVPDPGHTPGSLRGLRRVTQVSKGARPGARPSGRGCQ